MQKSNCKIKIVKELSLSAFEVDILLQPIQRKRKISKYGNALEGVYYENTDKGSVLVTTDGVGMTILKKKYQVSGLDKTIFRLPKIKKTETVSMHKINPKQLKGKIIELGSKGIPFRVVYPEIINSKFPDYKTVIPKAKTKESLINTMRFNFEVLPKTSGILHFYGQKKLVKITNIKDWEDEERKDIVIIVMPMNLE